MSSWCVWPGDPKALFEYSGGAPAPYTAAGRNFSHKDPEYRAGAFTNIRDEGGGVPWITGFCKRGAMDSKCWFLSVFKEYIFVILITMQQRLFCKTRSSTFNMSDTQSQKIEFSQQGRVSWLVSHQWYHR